MPATRTPDYAAFLARQLPLQQGITARYELDGERVWLKRAEAPHPAWRYWLQGWVARLARVPALAPIPAPGGDAGIALEVERLRTFAAHGLRVPEVLAHQNGAFLMRDMGDGTGAPRSLASDLEAADGANIVALWQLGLQAMDAVHREGLSLGQAFARNMVRCPDGAIACIDLESDPAARLTPAQSQVRDALTYLQSTAGYLHAAGAREAAREPWRAWVNSPTRSAEFRATLDATMARLTWLRYLPPDRRWGRDAYRLRAAYEQAVLLRYE